MNNELLEALLIIEKEKDISKETLLEAIENSLITACKNHFGKSDNIRVDINPKTCEFHVYAEKAGVEMPICECAYRVLYEGQSVREVVGALMSRNKKREADESWI